MERMVDPHLVKLNKVDSPEKKILFLGYDRTQTIIIDALVASGCEVYHTQHPIKAIHYDLIISFGYRYVLKKEIIDSASCPIFNLHISYLPYNRGTHPNFWSFYENTPSGVTIHLVDEGIDTGPIVYQKYVNFDRQEITYKQTYYRLIEEIEMLFITNLDDILNGNWVAKPQLGRGTFHKFKDLPKEFTGWDSKIKDEVRRLGRILGGV